MKTRDLSSAVMACLAIASPARADHWGFTPLLVAGQKPAGASGAITGFDSATIDDTGHVAVRAKTAAGAMLLLDGAFVAETGPAFASLSAPALSSGALGVRFVLAGAAHPAQFDVLRPSGLSTAIAEGGAVKSLGAIALCGDTPIFAADEGNGFGVFAAAATGAPTVLAPAQAVATVGELHCTPALHAGYVRTSASGSAIALAANGTETTLVKAGAYSNVLAGALDASDRIAFYGEYPDGAGVYRASATGTLPIAQTGSLWTSLSAAPPAIDGAGNVYFVGTPKGKSAVIALGSGDSATPVVSAGDTLLDGHTVKSVIAIHSSNVAAHLIIEVTRDDGADALYEMERKGDIPVLSAGPDITATFGQQVCIPGSVTSDLTPVAQIPVGWYLYDPHGPDRTTLLSSTTTLTPCFTPDTYGIWNADIYPNDPGDGRPLAGSHSQIYVVPPTGGPVTRTVNTEINGCSGPGQSERFTAPKPPQQGQPPDSQCNYEVRFLEAPDFGPPKTSTLQLDLARTSCAGGCDLQLTAGNNPFAPILGYYDDGISLADGATGVQSWDVNSAVGVWLKQKLGDPWHFGFDLFSHAYDQSVGGRWDVWFALANASAPQSPPTLTVTYYVCGDGTVDPMEKCDDGNTAGGDGCSPACNVEPGWTCTGTAPSVCTRDACTPDKTPPIVTLTGGLTTTVECKGTFTDPGATAHDDCAGALTPTATAAPSPITTATPGAFGVTYTATDPAGNAASATRLVVVQDSIAPVIASLAPQTVMGNCDGSPVTLTKPTATDACQSATVTCDALAGDATGTHAVNCTATDPSGNTSNATITVTVTAASCATGGGADGGTATDGGATADAGSGSTPAAAKKGCGCSASGAPSALWLALALLLGRRRRAFSGGTRA